MITIANLKNLMQNILCFDICSELSYGRKHTHFNYYGPMIYPFNPRYRAKLPEQSLKAHNLTVKRQKNKMSYSTEIARATTFNFMCTPLKLILSALIISFKGVHMKLKVVALAISVD